MPVRFAALIRASLHGTVVESVAAVCIGHESALFTDAERRMRRQKGRGHTDVLGRQESAGRINQPAARAHIARSSFEDCCLDGGQIGRLVERFVAQIRLFAQHAQARAGHVADDAVTRPISSSTGRRGVEGRRFDYRKPSRAAPDSPATACWGAGQTQSPGRGCPCR